MRMALRPLLSVVFAVLLAVACAQSARAQEAPSASETALAREQYRDGMAHAQAGRWPEAYAAFSRAYNLVRRPLVLLNLASAEEQTGRLVESAEHFRQFLREVTTGRDAAQRPVAEQGLARVEPRIARARFVLDAARSSDSYVLDTQSIATAAMGTALPLDPGEHTLIVSNAGAEIGRVTFTLAEGEAKDVPVAVTRPAQALVVTTRPDLTPHDVPPSRDDEHPAPPPRRVPPPSGGLFSSPVFWVIVGVVVVGGATAGVVVATSGGSEPFSGNLGSISVR